MLRRLNNFIISFLAFILGINYCLFAWLNYDIIGMNGDFMSSARLTWGIIQTIFGFLLLVLLYFRRITHIVHKYWTILMSIVFAMQLPIASLWYMTLMREPLDALLGVLLHTLLIGLIAVDYLTSHRITSKENNLNTNQEDTHIELDT